MKAEIFKNTNQFSLYMPYDKDIVSTIRTIPKRFWDSDFKTWYLPISSYPKMVEKLKARKCEIVDCNRDVITVLDGDTIHVRFTRWIETSPSILTIDGASYDPNKKYFSVPLSQCDTLDELFENSKLSVLKRIF
jgi:hypothetical protein